MVMTATAQENIFRRSRALQGIWSRPRLVLVITYAFVLAVLAFIMLVLEPWQAKALVPFFFLYAALPFPLIFVRLFRGKDITQLGSGNISLSNSFRVGGWAAGALTLLGEASKGFLAPLVSWAFFSSDVNVSAGLLASSMLGTFYSPFLKGKGGLGTTLAIWGLVFISPWSLLAILGIMGLLLLVHKDTYHDIMAVFWLAPVVIYLIDGRWPVVLVALLYACIYSVRMSRKGDEFSHGIRIAKK
jgi:acyl-phosphate glycerol 3-phosphate acyltransferase